MRQVLQHLGDGTTEVREVPAPNCGAGQVLIANQASLVSAGTERALIARTQRSLLGKARERPDEVRRVLQKMREEGILETLRQVRTRLAQALALGYSSSGLVLEVGKDVRRFRPGDRVASNGPHAQVVAVPQNLVAPLPGGLAFDQGCYGVMGAIALQGIRLARVGIGDRVAVIGLGVIGQIAIQFLEAAGCTVLGTDPDPARRLVAQQAGAEAWARGGFEAAIRERTHGHGADAVLITASTDDNEPVELAAAVARKKARVVVVGAVGMSLPRRDFYPKELELVVSCSYGPGRYDGAYEEGGQDYPYAYVRWTEQRNIEAVLEQIARKRVDVGRLTTHTFAIEEAERAYRLLEARGEPSLGIVLTYPPPPSDVPATRRLRLGAEPAAARPAAEGILGVGVVGAGSHASLVLLPLLDRTHAIRRRAICSSGGVHAALSGKRHGFEIACTAPNDIFDDPSVHAVIVATRHDSHSQLALAALCKGKHVFVEKPLAISAEQLDDFEAGLAELPDPRPTWMLGFNRRFSPAARLLAEFFSPVAGPRTVTHRFNAGPVPADHWTNDPAIGGGRLLGEACHALDLACFLVHGQIVRIFAESVAPGGSAGTGADQTIVVARFDNGSVASIGYFAGGDKGLPKERIEVFGGGRIAIIDDFRTITLCAGGVVKTRKLPSRDKGHAAELEAFFSAARAGGPPPIPAAALLNVSRASLAMVDSLRLGIPIAVPVF